MFMEYLSLSAWMLYPAQPGLALTGRVEARLVKDLNSVDRGVKRLQFTIGMEKSNI